MDQGPIRPLPESGTHTEAGFSSARSTVRGPQQGVFKRLVLLCLRPESWGDMARYPLRYTVWTVIMAVILSSFLTAIASSRAFRQELSLLASGYDSKFAPLTLAEGKLSVAKDTPASKLPKYEWKGTHIVVDPTGLTRPDELGDNGVLIGSDAIYTKYPWGAMRDPSLFDVLKNFGVKTEINSLTLKRFSDDYGAVFGLFWGLTIFCFSLMTHMLWAVIIAFLASPLVRIAAPSLRMPRGMAYRVSGAITVPLLILGAVLELVGHAPRTVLGGEGATLFWFFAAVCMSFWGGYLLNRHAVEALKRIRGK